METQKKVKSAGKTMKTVKGESKPWWYIWDFDENCYSTFKQSAGDVIEKLRTGEYVEIKYTQKGAFRNVDEVLPIRDVNEDVKEELDKPQKKFYKVGEPRSPEKIATALAESPDAKTADIHRQVAWKIAGTAWGWFDFEGKTESERMKLLSGLAKTIEEILNG